MEKGHLFLGCVKKVLKYWVWQFEKKDSFLFLQLVFVSNYFFYAKWHSFLSSAIVSIIILFSLCAFRLQIRYRIFKVLEIFVICVQQ